MCRAYSRTRWWQDPSHATSNTTRRFLSSSLQSPLVALLLAFLLGSARADAQNFALTVLGSGTGNGAVTAPVVGAVGAINCTITGGVPSGTCARTYPRTASVTLTAAASTGSVFTGWGGVCAARTTQPTCTLTNLTGVQSTTATFALVCTIGVTASAGGTAAVTSGGASGACGRDVTITATANPNFVFQNWTVGGANVSTANPRTFALNTSQVQNAVFAAAQCSLVLGTATGGTATLTSGTLTGDCGRSVTVTATPATGYRFNGWSDGGTPAVYTLPLTQTTLTLTPAFVQQCTLTLASSPPTGGTATLTAGSATGDCGRTVTATATPAPFHTFLNWSDGQLALSRDVVVSSVAQQLTASFLEPQCTLTLASGTGGAAAITNGSATGACGRSVTVTATPDANFAFSAFTEVGGAGSTANPWTITLTTNRSITATFAAVPQCTLTLGTATGGTAALTAGTLTGACGRSVTVVATPATGYRFDTWSDATNVSPYTFIIASSLTLTPSFVQQCTLTLAPAPANGGSVAVTGGSAAGDCGRDVTVTATPNANFTFTEFTENGASVGTTNPATLTLATDRSIVARFAPVAQCTLTLVAAPVAGGTATITTGSATGACGRTVTVAATPNAGYTFVSWSDASTAATRDVVVNSTAQVLTATFAEPQCTLTLTAGAGGTAAITNGAASGTCGRSVTVTATPNATFTFAAFTENGASVSTANPFTFTLSADRAIVATFAETPQCTLVLGTATGGAATLTAGTLTGACGRSVTVQATPTTGFRFDAWSDDTNVSPYTFVLSSSLTLTPRFVQQCTLTLAPAPANGGTVAVTGGSATGDCGRSVTVTATPNPDFTFTDFTENGASVGTTNPLTVVLATDRSLQANFAAVPQCTLTLTAGAGGTAAITNGAASGTCGRTLTITATPNATFTFTAFTENGSSVSTANPWTFTLAANRAIVATFAAPPQCNLVLGTATGGTSALTAGTLNGDCGRSVTVTATPNAGFRFSGWSDGASASPYTLTLTTPLTLTPSFVQQCTLSLVASPVAGGTATLLAGTPTGDCGRTVTATASPAAGYNFTSWSDGLTTPTRDVTVSTVAQVLTASFAQPQCTLVLGTQPGGTTAITSGAATGVCGRSVTVQATASPGYRFASWSDGVTITPYTVVVNAPTLNLSATFVQQCTLSLTATPPAGGSASLSAGALAGDCGRTVTAVATPAAGYQFAGWDDGVRTASRAVTVTQVTQALQASFVQPQCTLTLTAGTGGSATIINGSATGVCGRSVTIQATAEATFTFGGFSENGAVFSTVNPLTLVLSTDRTITATFAVVPQCSVTLSNPTAGGAAAVTAGSANGPCGRSITVTATPASGYRFSRWSDSTTVSPYTFVVSQALTLAPIFVQQCTLTLGVTPAAGGTATITSGGASGDCGRGVTVSAVAAAGYQFTSWSDGATGAVRTLVVRPDALTLTATFSLIPQCALTLGTATGGAAALTSGTLTGDCGRSVTVLATAANGFRFKAWSDSTSANPYTLTLTSAALTLTPDFAAQCTLVLSANPAAGGTVALSNGTLAGDCGRSVTATATANAGYAFTGWSEASAAASYTLTVTQSTQPLAALFSLTSSVRVVVSGASGTVLRAAGGAEVCALAPGETETTCMVALGADETLVAEPAVTTGFLGWRGVCAGRGTCVAGAGADREVKALFTPVRSIAADVAALDLLTGSGLSVADRELLDQTGNADGVFNLGDLLAHLERTKQTLTPSISSRIMNATGPLSQPIRTATPTPRP